MVKLKKITISFLTLLMIPVGIFNNNIPIASAASSACPIEAEVNGYSCTQFNYYISPSKVSQIASQTETLQSFSLLANFIGLSGLTAGYLSIVFGSAVAANTTFVQAANQGAGVQVSYRAFISLTTTDIYTTNVSYSIQ